MRAPADFYAEWVKIVTTRPNLGGAAQKGEEPDMATLTEWPLPTPTVPPSYGPFTPGPRFLTPARRGRLYYTKGSTMDALGKLDTQTGTTREWPLSSLSPGGPGNAGVMGVTLGLHGQVWLALYEWNRLVRFDPDKNDPDKGDFAAFSPPATGQGSFREPATIRVEASGLAWFTARWVTSGSSNGAAIGRLDPSQRSATLWRLPIGIYTPEGLWIESSTTVWFSTYHRFSQADSFCLCRLDVAHNRLDYWMPSSPSGVGLTPVYKGRGVVGDARGGRLEDIWFTYVVPGAAYPRVGRFHVPSGQFFEFVPTVPAAPNKLTLDRGGSLWIGHYYGLGINPGINKVSRIAPGIKGGKTKFIHKTVDIGQVPIEMAARSIQGVVATPQTVTSTSGPVVPVPDNSYQHFPLPSASASSMDISLSVGRAKSSVFFTEDSLNKIGELHP